MDENRKEDYGIRKMKQETLRVIALIFILCLAISMIFIYKEVKQYNDFIKETGRNPCAFCQEINRDIICQKIVSNSTEHVCKQCSNMGYGVLGYENTN